MDHSKKHKIADDNRYRRIVGLLLSFLVPFIIYGVVLYLNGITPFGDKTIAYVDANNQYLSFFSYFKQNLSHTSAFIYSTSGNIGRNFFGVFTYYLLNPLNLLVLFVSVAKMPRFLLIMVWLKISFSGLAMYIYLRLHFKLAIFKIGVDKRPRSIDILFSTAYALSAFSIAYMANVMWLDAVFLLPLIILGLESIFDGRRPYLFGFFLLYTLITQYYMGYIVSFFIVFEFLFLLFRQVSIKNRDNRVLLKRSLTAVVTGLLSIGLSALVLLPSFKSTIGVEKKPYFFTWDAVYSWMDGLKEVLAGIPGAPGHYGPLIFTGSLVLVSFFLFFLNRRVTKREKGLYLALVVILIVFSNTSGLYLAWHAFTSPNGFAQRESFCIAFVLIQIAATNFHNGLEIDKKEFRIFLLSSGTLLLVLSKIEPFITNWVIYYNILAFGIFGVLLMNNTGKAKKLSNYFLIVLSLIDIGYGVWGNWSSNQTNLMSSAFTKYVDNLQPAINYVKNHDSSFYRIGTSSEQSSNQPFLLNYNGVSGYTSTQPTSLVHFMSALGYHQNHDYTRWSNYNNGSTLAMDELLGIKYQVINHNKEIQDSSQSMVAALGYENLVNKKAQKNQYIRTINGFKIYKDKNAFPLAVNVSDQVLKSKHSLAQKNNPFPDQNKIWQQLSVDPNTVLNVKDTVKRMDKESASTRVYRIFTHKKGELYANFPDDKPFLTLQALDLRVNGILVTQYRTQGENGIVDLGYYKKGESVDVSLKAVDRSNIVGLTRPAHAYTQDRQALTHTRKKVLSGTTVKSKFIDHRRIALKTNGKQQTIMLTIPYSTDWQLRANDGQKLKSVRAFGTLMGIQIPHGVRKVTMTYEPDGLKNGLLMSTIFFVISIAVIWFYEKHLTR